MESLLPLRSESRPDPGDGARIVDVDADGDTDAGEVLEALAAETTRAVLSAVYEQPGTASEIADRVDTSLQNATYHLEKLQDVDLIEVGDTWYSEQGNAMDVYVPKRESVVVVAGNETTRSTLRERLSRWLGVVSLLAVGSLLVERIITVPSRTTTLVATKTGDYQANVSTDPTFLPRVELGGGLTPGAVFLLGGLTALLAVALMGVAVRNR